jgi:serine/threonine-protein kinase
LSVIAVGATVGNYQVVEKIGGGAMGAVFLAVHPIIGKRVALKAIHPELATNEEVVARFFNEARAVTQIGHENIVDVQDFGQTPEGDSFIVMELLEGVGLGDRLKAEGAFSVPRSLHIAIQMADALAAAHARGIIHRDLKPDNVMLIPRGGDPDFVKLLDFGLAKLTGPGGMSTKTKTGALLGTPHYMAPEQAEGKKNIDQRADVYGLGCILFHLLTGRVPFPGEGFGEVLVKHLREPPPLPSRLNASVPPAVEKIVLHALAKKPEFRFGSMDDFRAAMRDPERFVRLLESGDRLTPGEMAAPTLPPTAPPPAAPPRMMTPPEAPARIGADAKTVSAGAPPEVQKVLDRAANIPWNPSDVSTAPGRQREHKPTVAQPHAKKRAKRRSRYGVMMSGFLGTLVLALGAAGWYLHAHGAVAVRIAVEPAGADVLRDDRLLGVAPMTLTLARGEEAQLSFRKEGFLPSQRVVKAADDEEISVRLLPKPAPEPEPAPEPTPPPVPPPAAAPPPKPAVAAAAPESSPKPHRSHTAKKAKNPDQLLLMPSF